MKYNIECYWHNHIFSSFYGEQKNVFSYSAYRTLEIIMYFMLRHQTMAVLQQKHGVKTYLGDRDFVSVLYDDSASPSPVVCV